MDAWTVAARRCALRAGGTGRRKRRNEPSKEAMAGTMVSRREKERLPIDDAEEAPGRSA